MPAGCRPVPPARTPSTRLRRSGPCAREPVPGEEEQVAAGRREAEDPDRHERTTTGWPAPGRSEHDRQPRTAAALAPSRRSSGGRNSATSSHGQARKAAKSMRVRQRARRGAAGSASGEQHRLERPAARTAWKIRSGACGQRRDASTSRWPAPPARSASGSATRRCRTSQRRPDLARRHRAVPAGARGSPTDEVVRPAQGDDDAVRPRARPSELAAGSAPAAEPPDAGVISDGSRRGPARRRGGRAGSRHARPRCRRGPRRAPRSGPAG